DGAAGCRPGDCALGRGFFILFRARRRLGDATPGHQDADLIVPETGVPQIIDGALRLAPIREDSRYHALLGCGRHKSPPFQEVRTRSSLVRKQSPGCLLCFHIPCKSGASKRLLVPEFMPPSLRWPSAP